MIDINTFLIVPTATNIFRIRQCSGFVVGHRLWAIRLNSFHINIGFRSDGADHVIFLSIPKSLDIANIYDKASNCVWDHYGLLLCQVFFFCNVPSSLAHPLQPMRNNLRLMTHCALLTAQHIAKSFFVTFSSLINTGDFDQVN